MIGRQVDRSSGVDGSSFLICLVGSVDDLDAAHHEKSSSASAARSSPEMIEHSVTNVDACMRSSAVKTMARAIIESHQIPGELRRAHYNLYAFIALRRSDQIDEELEELQDRTSLG